MNDMQLREKLAQGNLTKTDVLAILEWQLSLPAEEMDCGLIAECELYLAPDAPGLGKEREDAMFASLLAQIDATESASTAAQEQTPAGTRPAAQTPARRTSQQHNAHRSRSGHRRPLGKVMIVALVALMLLALAVGGVAYGYRRGVLNFTEDFGFAQMVSQDGAEEFVTSGSLAHLELEHVTVDVIEAVYDGTELRVVYGLTSKDGQIHMAEHAEYFVMPGSEEGDVHMCDYIVVNGQDAFFYDAWEAAGENGQVLYYLQTNLLEWGVDVSDADELLIGLPMLPKEDPTVRGPWPTVDFTIPAKVPDDLVRTAAVVEANMDGHAVSVKNAIFSPLNGYVELYIEGLTEEYYYRNFSTLCEVYAMDGSLLTSSHMAGNEFTEDGAVFGVSMTPTVGEWPDQMIVAFEFEDYSPDWEAVIQLSPKGE